jgi:hypothetical protein
MLAGGLGHAVDGLRPKRDVVAAVFGARSDGGDRACVDDAPDRGGASCREYRGGAADVDPDGCCRVARRGIGQQRREVHDRFGLDLRHRCRQRGDVGNIALDVGSAASIDGRNLVSCATRARSEGLAEKAGASGHQRSHVQYLMTPMRRKARWMRSA